MPERARLGRRKEGQMLWTLLVILLVLWVLGLLFSIGGGLIHILLVIAVVVLIYQLLTGRRAV
jgi:hypothetical protein